MIDTGASERQSFSQSFRRLQQAQKPRIGVPLYSVYVNRPAGRAVAAALANTSVTPNQVSVAGAVITYGALLWLGVAAPTSGLVAVVGVMLTLGFILDSADGQLARLRGGGTPLGEWLDHCLDNGRIAIMHIAVLAYLMRSTSVSAGSLVLICGVFLFANTTMFFGGTLFDQFRRRDSTRPVPATVSASARRRALFRSLVTVPVDYGITCLVFLTLPWPTVFLALYGFLAAVHAIFGTAYAVKWGAELLRSDG